MSDRVRTALAFFLIVCILLLWTFLSKRKTPPVEPVEPIASDTVERIPTDTTVRTMPEEKFDEDSVVIDQEHIRIVLCNRGGAVKSFVLKDYDIDIVPAQKSLFSSRSREGALLPFEPAIAGDTVRFLCQDGSLVTKTYIFNDAYGFRLLVDVPAGYSHVLSLKSGLRVTEGKNSSEDLRHFNVYVKQDNITSVKGKIKDTYDVHGNISWFGLRTKYFLLVTNTTGALDRVTFYKLDKDETAQVTDIQTDQAFFGCYYWRGGGNRYGAEVYVQDDILCDVKLLPVQYNFLAQYKEGYEHVTSGGILGPISRLFLAIFNLLYALFKNYGLAIIVFAICIKLVFFPLSRQMIKSQHRMQMIQPELKKLQQKYKEDPQRLNQEMMHLYKTYKVNPFTGCLPLVVQMPIFFALYQTLTIIMPLFLVFIFLNFPSGLQLYWFSYNILTLVEHIMIKRGGMK
jgi:hypothetical protein